jgi:predicted metalloprotease with PDZ domain
MLIKVLLRSPAFILLPAVLVIFVSLSTAAQNLPAASYHIKLALIGDAKIPKLEVTALVPIDGKELRMTDTRPGDVPEVGDNGWPALIRELQVSDERGRKLEIKPVDAKGWELIEPHKGRLKLAYQVDYSIPAAAGWPAPRETAFRDETHFLFVGRSAFITTTVTKASTVSFSLPAKWRAVAPWRAINPATFTVAKTSDLIENLIVFTNAATDRITAGGFNVSVTAMGHWQAVRPEIAALLRKVIPRYVKMFGGGGDQRRENYSVILLPVLDTGGESYRGSFAFNVPKAPSKETLDEWGHTIAHEIFHYWNGWRMAGAGYAATQWFQEGFTDYAADLAMLSAGHGSEGATGMVGPGQFRRRIGLQIAKYRKLKTPLALPGTHKGPPLYGGGALVALCWDIQIRHATAGKHNIGDVFTALWLRTKNGEKDYDWTDIKAALETAAPLDWESFYRRYIEGTEKLPLDEVLPLAGLKLARAADGTEEVEIDANASPEAKSIWLAMTEGK